MNMVKKVIKIIEIILVVVTIFNMYLVLTNKSFALGDVTKNPDMWIDTEKDEGEGLLNEKASIILGMIRGFGVIASIITVAIIGIRIMFGSVEEKANYKQTLLPWCVGAVMLFAMSVIPSIVYEIIDTKEFKSEVEIRSKNEIEQGTFCIKGNLMGTRLVEGAMGVHQDGWLCYKEEGDENKCGCDDKDSGQGYYCGNCYNTAAKKKKAKKLKEIKLKGQNYYHCNRCGNIYEKP